MCSHWDWYIVQVERRMGSIWLVGSCQRGRLATLLTPPQGSWHCHGPLFKIPLPFYSYHLGPVLSTDFCTGESSPTGKTYWDVAYALSVHRFTTPYILLPHPLWEAMLWHFLTFYMTSLDWVWYFMVLSFFFKTCKQIIFFFKISTCGVLLSNSFSNNFKYK